MKIALVSPLPPYRGGIATFSDHLIRHLTPQHEIYGINFRRLYPQILFPGKSQLHSEHVESSSAKTDSIVDSVNPFSWGRAARRISSFDPDVCIFAYWMPFFIPAYRRIMSGLSSGCKTVMLCHNVQEHESIPGLRGLKRRFFQAADKLVVLSTISYRQLDMLKVNRPTSMLFHPLSTGYGEELHQEKAKERLGIPENIPVILYFGLVRPYKGLPHLLEAAGDLKQRDIVFHLRVAGEFYQGFDEARALVNRLGLEAVVTLENRFIQDHEVAAYFSASDVVALPYLAATQSGVVPIAYHFNRPVVVTDVGGLPEVVQGGETGYLVPPGDSLALANALERDLPDGFRAMRKKVARFKEQYSWARFVSQLEHFLSE
jgi:glycosyltransferase involved in cell wall biosynthesis